MRTLILVASVTMSGCLLVAGCASSGTASGSSSPGTGSTAPASSGSASGSGTAGSPTASAPSAVSVSSAFDSPTSTSAATLSGNRAAASSEATRLLALAVVPPGAIALTTAPASVAGGPPLGSAATSSFIDKAAYWRVPLSFAAALAWIKAHPPAGLPSGGSSSGGGGEGGGSQNAGFSYSAPDAAAWEQAQFEIEVGSDTAGTSYLRADGVALALDPVPQSDTAGEGTRLRLTVSAGCPATVAGDVDVTNAGSDLTSALLPSGVPTAALLCAYGPNVGPATAGSAPQIDHWRLAAAGAATLAAAVRGIPLSHLDDAMTSCPMDDGAVTVLAFSYAGRADVDLWWSTTGCQSLENGDISASPYGPFQDTFDALTGIPQGSSAPTAAAASPVGPAAASSVRQLPIMAGSPAAP
jgi:hypothetical protein